MDHTPTLLRCWRKNSDSRPLRPEEIKRLAAALLSLQRGLTGKRTLAGSGYMNEDASLGAYLLYYYRITYAQITFAVHSFLSRTDIHQKSSLRILDVGCGPAPAAMALIDVLDRSGMRKRSFTLTCVDASEKALSCARKIFSADRPDVTVKIKCRNLENDSLILDESFDVILISHTLNELWENEANGQEKRLRLLTTLKEHLTEQGVLLLCEPALRDVSRNTIDLAMRLLEGGMSVLAPCPSEIEKTHRCPIFQSNTTGATCHAEVFTRFPSDVLKIAREAGLTRLSVKMTFFALQNMCNAHTKSEGGTPHYRVVSDAMLNKAGRIRYLLCDGLRRIPISAKTGDKSAQNLGFFNLKRYDAVTVINPEIRGDAQNPSFGIDEKTRLTVRPFAPHSQGSPGPLLQAKSRARREKKKRGHGAITPKR